MSDPSTVDVYWSFRSPYSYLATPRLRAAAEAWGVSIRPRPVYPIAIRTPEFFAQAHPHWAPYLLKDIVRLSEFLDLPLSWPVPDPVVQEAKAGLIAAEQPYIHRLTRMGVLACEQGDNAGWAFLDEVSRLIWSGTPWNEGDVLANAVARAGFDLAELDSRQDSEAERLSAVIECNQAAHSAYHWGVPVMVFREEAFFGQDRIDLLEWRVNSALAAVN